MRRGFRLLAAALCAATFLACAPSLAAQQIKPFKQGSMKQIVAARQGKPFILGLWSLTCAHCREELAMLGELMKKHPGLNVVLVSTDTPEESAAVAATLAQHGLDKAGAWVFADDFAERLRFEVDKKWRGELPRIYFYDAAGNRDAKSGKLDPAQVESWVQEHFVAASPNSLIRLACRHPGSGSGGWYGNLSAFF